MTINAVVCGVGDAVLEPFDEDVGLIERAIFHLAERLHPMNPLGLLGPKTVRIGERALVHFPVFGFVDKGAFRPFGGEIENFVRRIPFLRCRWGLTDNRFPPAYRTAD